MSDEKVSLYLEWEEALNQPEVDVARVDNLESQAREIGLDLWQINNLMLNSMIAAIAFNPDLHPRGRDGKFIESFGIVRLFDFVDRRGERHGEAVGRVTDITPDRASHGNPDIEVELAEGGHVTVKPNQVASAPQVKGRLEGENRPPTIAEAEDLLDREAGERLMKEKPLKTPDVDEDLLEEEVAFADTIYNTSRDIGMLGPGDEIILPGDIPGTIVEFEFPGGTPDAVIVHTDGGTYHGKTGDILPNYRPGEEVNPIGEPVMEKPGEPGSKNNPIKTSDPLEAVKALRDGKFVELESVDQVSTLLNELADIAQDAKAKGDKAPDYDLCLVSVPGTNLFCAESKGIPRIEMPQLSGFPTPGSKADSLPRTEEGGVDIGPAFMDHLRGKGVGVTEERRLASHLKASQSELIGSKIAGMMRAMDSGNEFAIRNIRENPIFVTSDGYVIDGHHRWASVLGWDSLEGGLDDYDMPVRVIDMDIMEVLSEANKFANDFGIPQVSSSDVGPEIKQVNPPSAPEVPSAPTGKDGKVIEEGALVEWRDGLRKRRGRVVKGSAPGSGGFNRPADQLQVRLEDDGGIANPLAGDVTTIEGSQTPLPVYEEDRRSMASMPGSTLQAFRERNVDLDLAAEARARVEKANAIERSRQDEMNRRG